MIVKEAYRYTDTNNSEIFSLDMPDEDVSIEKMVCIMADINKVITQNNQYSFITKYLTQEEYLKSEFQEIDNLELIQEEGEI